MGTEHFSAGTKAKKRKKAKKKVMEKKSSKKNKKKTKKEMKTIQEELKELEEAEMRERKMTGALISVFIETTETSKIRFDKISVTPSNGKTLIVSTKGLSKGKHQWSFEIMRTDVQLQEIGVIGTADIDHIPVSDEGAMYTPAFKSRAIYGSDMSTGNLCYGSWNANNQTRCLRDLTPYFKLGWTVGDVITVGLNFDDYRVTFMLNGRPVRYMISLEPNKVYFPMICFSGDCRYFQE